MSQQELFTRGCEHCGRSFCGVQGRFVLQAHELACNAMHSVIQYECNRMAANANACDDVISIEEYLSTEGSTL